MTASRIIIMIIVISKFIASVYYHIGLWETLYHPNFKHIEFDVFKNQAGLNGFVLSPKQWIDRANVTLT